MNLYRFPVSYGIKKLILVLFIAFLVITPLIASADFFDNVIPCKGGFEQKLDNQGNPILDDKGKPILEEITEANKPDHFCTVQDFLVMVISIINLAIQASGSVAVLVIVFFGGEMVNASLYGNSEQYQAGKQGVTRVILGLLLILSAYAIVNGIWMLVFPETYGPMWSKPWQ